MKKLLLFIFFIPAICLSQTIEKNEIDEFKGTHIIQTSWENLISKNSFLSPTTVRYRLSSLDGVIHLETKTILNAGEIFQINQGSELIFILENKEKVTFKTINDGVFGVGEGSVGFGGSALWGVHTFYTSESDDHYHMIVGSPPVKARLYTDEGYIESDIKKRDYKKLQKSVELIINE